MEKNKEYIECYKCMGSGITIGVIQDCCGYFEEKGYCCGNYIEKEVQLQCDDCQATGVTPNN